MKILLLLILICFSSFQVSYDSEPRDSIIKGIKILLKQDMDENTINAELMEGLLMRTGSVVTTISKKDGLILRHESLIFKDSFLEASKVKNTIYNL